LDRWWGEKIEGRGKILRRRGKSGRGKGQRSEQSGNGEVGGVRIVFWNVAGVEGKDKEFWKGIKE